MLTIFHFHIRFDACREDFVISPSSAPRRRHFDSSVFLQVQACRSDAASAPGIAPHACRYRRASAMPRYGKERLRVQPVAIYFAIFRHYAFADIDISFSFQILSFLLHRTPIRYADVFRLIRAQLKVMLPAIYTMPPRPATPPPCIPFFLCRVMPRAMP